ncbi:MAG: hypothetical protein V8Q36_02770 [Anaerotignum sp.]
MIEAAITSHGKWMPRNRTRINQSAQLRRYETNKRNAEGGGARTKPAEWIGTVVLKVSGVIKFSVLRMDISVSGGKIDKINTPLWRKRRESGRPLWYVLGTCDFYGLRIQSGRARAYPRPETEELVETAIGLLNRRRLRSRPLHGQRLYRDKR